MTDPMNASVTPTMRNLAKSFSSELQDGDKYVVVDMSDSNVISSFVPLDKVVEIYDHHFGFEEYWKKRLGDRSKIQPIGAAATLIWEEFKQR